MYQDANKLVSHGQNYYDAGSMTEVSHEATQTDPVTIVIGDPSLLVDFLKVNNQQSGTSYVSGENSLQSAVVLQAPSNAAKPIVTHGVSNVPSKVAFSSRRSESKQPAGKFNCPLCPQLFHESSSLYVHLQYEHKGDHLKMRTKRQRSYRRTWADVQAQRRLENKAANSASASSSAAKSSDQEIAQQQQGLDNLASNDSENSTEEKPDLTSPFANLVYTNCENGNFEPLCTVPFSTQNANESADINGGFVNQGIQGKLQSSSVQNSTVTNTNIHNTFHC